MYFSLVNVLPAFLILLMVTLATSSEVSNQACGECHSCSNFSMSLAYRPDSQAQENCLCFASYEMGSTKKLGWTLRSEYYSTLAMELCLGFSVVAETEAGRLLHG